MTAPVRRCPTCHGALVDASHASAEALQCAPFCSNRCQMADLGRWLSGAYRVAGDPLDVTDLPDAPQGAPRE